MKNLNLNLKPTVSNIFVISSFIWMIIYYLWLTEKIFFLQNTTFWLLLLFFISTFIHWWILHFFFNSVFILYFWNILETSFWKTKFILFFIFTIIFTGFWIKFIYWFYNTIWISWFCMALLSYYTLYLKDIKSQEYLWGLIFLGLNIWYWFTEWISFWWHFFGAIAWIIFYYLNKDFFRRKIVWA